MSYEGHEPELEYYPCRYGRSRIVFRGPRVSIDGPYTVVLGGSEVYGKFIEDPFCDQLADRTGRQVVNLGVMNASTDLFLRDEALMEVVCGAESVVIQAMGAGNISNRYYSVHPRRNDRFLRHSRQMEKLFPEVDFSDFAFTRHMLHALKSRAPVAFRTLETELRAAWVTRMRLLLSRLSGHKTLLWIENRVEGDLGPEPLFVTVDMMQGLEGQIHKVAHCDVTDDLTEEAFGEMVFTETEQAQARQMLPPAAHNRIAQTLSRALRRRNGLAAA
ncbi:MAG: DUF6473 family protein [Pseudomonadota bacterium]